MDMYIKKYIGLFKDQHTWFRSILNTEPIRAINPSPTVLVSSSKETEPVYLLVGLVNMKRGAGPPHIENSSKSQCCSLEFEHILEVEFPLASIVHFPHSN